MIDLGRHMWDHYLAFFIFKNIYYIYEIITVYEWQEEFEARLSQAVFDVVSSVGESQLTPLGLVEEQRLRTWCWGATAGPKRKGHLYGSGDFVHTYKCGDDNFMQHTQGSSSRTQDLVGISRLREELRQSKEEIHAFQSVVLQFLSPEAWNIIHQHQQSHQQY